MKKSHLFIDLLFKNIEILKFDNDNNNTYDNNTNNNNNSSVNKSISCFAKMKDLNNFFFFNY